MASASWCKETNEKINYTKLCRLLVDGGTQAVCSVFDGKYPPSLLKAFLNAYKTTLQKLKKPKGKVLNNDQWDKLYPPNGSDPQSKDFDITLLFVILRNICGLTAPATGWDVLPPVADNSLEANLARIKYYRNNTIAHKPNTDINDADFEKHWQDISSALLSLGLSQDDIDDLKSAPLGMKDYNQLLNDWYISDKDVKTQLEDLKSHTAYLKSDTADLKSDTADLKLDTADLKSDTADLKSDTADLKSDTADLKSGTADIKPDTTDIKSGTADLKSDTADLKSDTADLKSDTADLKSGTADLKSDTADLKSGTADLKSDTADLKSDTAAIKDKIDDVRNVCIETRQRNQRIQQLAISDFRPEINTKCKFFHPNTRQWILDQVKSHVDSDHPDSCIMLITAGPGMGKSTLAAKICQTYKDLGCLAGCHFFQFSNATRNNPRLMLQSIAKQMCGTVPGYREELEKKMQTDLGKKVSEMNCEELLTILLEEPLCEVEQKDSNLVVVIDALDECSHDPKDELLKALRKKLPCFPSWLRFILTSRPSTNTSALGPTVAVEIRPEDESNMEDLKIFLSFELKALYPQCDIENNADLLKNLVEMTEGLFLVAFFVTDYLKRENIASPEEVLELFPNGISSVYENYFSRLKKVLLPYLSKKEGFYKMLEAVAATENPLPKNMFYNILCLKNELEEKRKRKDALNSLHWLFPVEGDHVTAFHKSVFDWLILQGDEEHDFSVGIEDGEEVLVSQCNDVLSDIRNGKKDLDKPLYLTDSEKYALGFLRYLVDKNSSVVKGDKYEFFSNIYLLTAIKIAEDDYFGEFGYLDIYGEVSPLLKMLQEMTFRFSTISGLHDPSCHLFRPISFGRYLAIAFQHAHVMGMTTPKLPFLCFYKISLLQSHFVSIDESKRPMAISSSFLQRLLKFKDGFIAVRLMPYCSTAVYTFHLDGRFIKSKSFLYEMLITTSPNINFIVVAQENGNKIEILDATTLEVTSQYESPHDEIQTCHVFGDDQGCFVVIKGCKDNKVYVIEGLTGHVHNIITVSQDSTVMDVSCEGHIVVTRRWERDEPENVNTITTKDGEVELMNWWIGDTMEFPETGFARYIYNYVYLEMLLYHYDRAKQSIPVYPLAEKTCSCPSPILVFPSIASAVHVSEDGRLLAYHYKHSIFIVNTSDGSLFKRWVFDVPMVSFLDILFVSRSYLLIVDKSFMFVINLQTEEIEHRIYLPYPVFPNDKRYLLFSEEDGKSFNLISSHYNHSFYEVSRLVFHNLNLQGFQ